MYAIVQHSGFAVGGDTEFARAVEPISLSTTRARAVTEAGGVVFGRYGAAEGYCEQTNYPPGVTGLIPQAPGGFHPTVTVHGLPLYLPAPADGIIIIIITTTDAEPAR